MNKGTLIEVIVEMEWEMFSSVKNVGGKASCQQDPGTFKIMRKSQFTTWADAVLASYCTDLENARKQGRNLMTEKYARMMQSTHPDEYARIAEILPHGNPQVTRQIEEIVATHVQWKKDLGRKYPHLDSRGRAISTRQDTTTLTSMETYIRAELQTYSPATVSAYYENLQNYLQAGHNAAEEDLLHQVRQYGFANLEEAETHFANSDGRI